MANEFREAAERLVAGVNQTWFSERPYIEPADCADLVARAMELAADETWMEAEKLMHAKVCNSPGCCFHGEAEIPRFSDAVVAARVKGRTSK